MRQSVLAGNHLATQALCDKIVWHVRSQDTLAREHVNTQGTLACELVSV